MILFKLIVILFGVFLIIAGCLMLFNPKKTQEIIKKAGSTKFINYAELIIRMIPAIGLIGYSMHSKFSLIFKIVGWFILGSSIVLCLIPRRIHHNYAVKASELIKPLYFQIISPISFAFGGWFIYAVL